MVKYCPFCGSTDLVIEVEEYKYKGKPKERTNYRCKNCRKAFKIRGL